MTAALRIFAACDVTTVAVPFYCSFKFHARGKLSLIVGRKLFTSGEESLQKLRPQPMVNNFASPALRAVHRLTLGATGSTVTPGREDESVSLDVGTSTLRPSLPTRRLDSKRMLQMPMFDVSAIRISLSPSQRARHPITWQP